MFKFSIFIALFVNCLCGSRALMGSGSGLPSGKVAKDEVPLIACPTCDYFSRALHDNLKKLQIEANNSNKRISETKVEELLESMCDATSVNGRWIRKLDIDIAKENSKSYLTLTAPGIGSGISACGNECATIVRSCEMIYEEGDLDDFLFFIWKKTKNKNDIPTSKELYQHICMESGSKRCAKKPKEYKKPKGKLHRENEEFHPISEKDLEMEELLKNMRDSGLGDGLNLYDKETAMERMMNEYGMEDMEDMGGFDEMGEL